MPVGSKSNPRRPTILKLTLNKPRPMRTPAHLADLAPGQSATIAAIAANPGLRNRLEALGLCRGQRVQMLRRAWLAGPLHVRVGMTELMLRRADAARVGLEAGLEVDLDPWPVAA